MKFFKQSFEPVTVPPARQILAKLTLFVAVMMIGALAQARTLYWDGDSVSFAFNGDGASDGGDGTWDGSIKNWDQGNLQHVSFNKNDIAMIGGIPGVVTLGSNVQAIGAFFNVDGYTLSGSNTLTLTTGGLTANGSATINCALSSLASQIWTTAAGKQLTINGAVSNGGLPLTVTGSGNALISGVISGAGAMNKTGAGTLVLTGLNTYDGYTTISGGVLQVGNGVADGSIAGSTGITNNASLVFNIASSRTYTNVITGTGALTMSGAGTQVLTGNNSYTGATLISSGTLQIGNGISDGGIASTASVTNNGSLLFNLAGSGTFGKVISGTGNLTKSGGGTLRLTGTNAYSGSTIVSGGKLSVGSDSALGTAPGSPRPGNLVMNGGTLVAENTFDLNSNRGVQLTGAGALEVAGGSALGYGGIIAGGGVLTKSGSGTLRFTGTNAYTGATTIASGTLELGNGTINGSIESSSGVTNRGALVLNVADNTTQAFSRVISGTGSLTKNGAGSLVVTGLNTFTGPTTISSGTVQLGNGVLVGTLGGSTITNNGTLVIRNHLNNMTSDKAVNGNGTVILDSGTSGSLTASGASGYTGATIVRSGMLKLGAAGNGTNTPLGTTANGTTVVDGATLDLNGVTLSTNESLTISGMGIANAGALVNHDGTEASYQGEILLGADSSIGGVGHTTINGVISGASKGFTKVGEGILTLTATNSYTGATVVSEGKLAVNGLLNAGSAASVQGGAVLLGTGTVGGTVMVADSATASITAGNGETGTLTLGNLTFSGAGQVNIGPLLGYTSNPAVKITGTLAMNGGNGAVTLSLHPGELSNGTYHLLGFGSFLGDVSQFTVTGPLLGTRQSGSLTNNMGMLDYVVNGASVYWIGAAGSVWDTSQINWKIGQMGGEAQYLESDTVHFDDSATGTTTVEIASNVNPAAMHFDNNTKAYILQGNAGITTGQLTKSGTGKLTITNANTYDGGTCLYAGVLEIGNDNALGTGVLDLMGGTLSSDSTSARTLSNPVAFENNATFGSTVNHGALTFSGTSFDLGDAVRTLHVISEVNVTGEIRNGGITKTGTGVLKITGSNSFTADTTLTEGTIAIDSAHALGAGSSMLVFGGNGTLRADANVSLAEKMVFSPGVSATIDTNGYDLSNRGSLSGSGSLVKSGSGTLTLTSQANNFTGATTINEGILEIGNGTSDGSIESSSRVENHSILKFNLAGSQAYGKVISGTGALVKAGAGSLTLTGNNTLTGAVRIEAGTLQIGDGMVDGSIANSSSIENNGALVYDLLGEQSHGQAISGVGSLTKRGTGTLRLTGSNAYSGGTILEAGTLAVDNEQSLGNSSGSLTFAGDSRFLLEGDFTSSRDVLLNSGATARVETGEFELSHQGTISGSGDLVKTGAGVLTLNGTNTYTGRTTVNAGTLRINSDASLGAVPETRAFGQLVLNGGTLAVSNPGDDIHIAANRGVSITAPSVFHVDAGTEVVFWSNVDGPCAFTKEGEGTLELYGRNTFDGQVILKAGTIEINSALSLGDPIGGELIFAGDGTLKATEHGAVFESRDMIIADGKTASFHSNGNGLTVSGTISGNGSLNKIGEATLLLQGTNTYAGSTTISLGTLEIGLAGNLGNSSYAGDISNSGTLFVNTTSAQILSGEISGSGALLKDNTGTLTLNGVSTYAGDTTVNSGTLLVAGALANTSAVSLAEGATMTVNGSINTGAETSVLGTLKGSGTLGGISIGDGGLLSPGNSPGIIRVGALEFSGTSARLLMEIGGTIAGVEHDQIIADGPISLNNATLELSLLNGYQPVSTDQLLLIINGDATLPDIGTFNGLSNNSTIVLTNDQGTFGFRIHYADVDANGSTDVYLTGPDAGASVTWGSLGSDPLAGILDGTLIPTSTEPGTVTFSNVNGKGFDVVVYTKNLNQSGLAVLPWNSALGWWFEGGAASKGGNSIPYSTVEFRFYQTGTDIPYGLTGVKFRFEDAESGERFRNFGYWNSLGEHFTDAFYDPTIFSFSAKPVWAATDQSVANGAGSSAGTQEGRWIDVDLSALAISGFTFQSGRYNSNSGSVTMTALGDNLVATDELLIQSGTDYNVSAGPSFTNTGGNAFLSGTSITEALISADVSITSEYSQNISLNTSIVNGSGHSLSMVSTVSIASLSSSLRTSSTTGNAGAITLSAAESIWVPYLETGASTANGGAVTLTAGNDIKTVTGVTTHAAGSTNQAGSVIMNAAHDLLAGVVRTGGGSGVVASGTAGNVTLTAGDSIKVDAIYARSATGAAFPAITLTSPLITLGKSGTVSADISGTMLLRKPVSADAATIAISGTVTGPGSLVIEAGTGRADLYANATLTGTTHVTSGMLATNGKSLASSDLILSGTSTLFPGVNTLGGSIALRSLTTGSNTTIHEMIGSAFIFDKVQVSGTATLDGIFKLSIGTGYTPALDTRFQVMSFGTRIGTFGAYEGLRLSDDLVMVPEYDATGMWLHATAVVQSGLLPLRTVPDAGISIADGESYDGLTVESQGISLITNATIIGGTASQNTTVQMALLATGTAGFQAGSIISGYVLELEGTQSDMFVLELEYNEAAAIAAVGDERNMFVCSSDGGPFANAVVTNTGPDNNPTQFFRAYNPATDFHLGYYGVDTVNNRVWAVLNHNSEFGLGVKDAPPATGAISSTQLPSAVTATTVALNGLVHPSGYATSAFFEYGTDPDLVGASTSASIQIDPQMGFVPVTIPVNDLASASTYYFRAAGVTSTGTNRGSILSFVTPPLVSVRALVADAYELGSLGGQFEIARSGSAALNVRYSIAGSGSNGRRFSVPVGFASIPAGATSLTLNVSPIANNLFDGDETVVISLESGNGYEVGNASFATVTIHDKPQDQWKGWAFGADANNPAISGDAVVHNGAGISNLMAYGLGLNPKAATVAGLPATGKVAEAGNEYLALSFTRNPKAQDVVYTIQASNDLVTWTDISVCRGGSWTHSGNVVESPAGESISVHVRDIEAMSASNARFIRLHVGH